MYKIIIEKAAEKFIRKQNKAERVKLYNLIKMLPYGKDIKKLRGFKNKYRLRVNNYRVIYNKYDDEPLHLSKWSGLIILNIVANVDTQDIAYFYYFDVCCISSVVLPVVKSSERYA